MAVPLLRVEQAMYQVTETLSEGLKREFTVVVDAEEIAERVDARLAEIGSRTSTPGFRPGKVPINILRSRFGPSVTGEVLKRMTADATDELLAERGMSPVERPRVEIKRFDVGKDLEFDLRVEILPQIAPVDFAAIELTRLTATAGEAEVAEALDGLAESRRRTEPVAPPHPAAVDDTRAIDVVDRGDGGAVDDVTGDDVTGDDVTGDDVTGDDVTGDDVTGDDVTGDDVTGDDQPVESGAATAVRLPESADDPAEKLPVGQEESEVTEEEMRAPDAVAIDDGFARELGFEDLASLKDMMREQLDRQYGRIARTCLKRQLFDLLADAHSFDVPPSLLDAEFEMIWKQVEAAREVGELDEDDAAKDEDSLRSEYRDIALRRMRLGLLLADIGRRNGLSVTEDETNRAMMAEARRFPGNEQQVLNMLQGDEQAQFNLRAPLFEEKVVDFIVEMAQIVDKEVSVTELIDTQGVAPDMAAPVRKRLQTTEASAEQAVPPGLRCGAADAN